MDDFDDPICSSANTLFEIDGPVVCINATMDLDNDADGSVDAEDLGCDNGYDDDEQDPMTECNDGIDNDFDGWTDLQIQSVPPSPLSLKTMAMSKWQSVQ